MRAEHTCNFTSLEADLRRNTEVGIRYRKDGENREEWLGYSGLHGPRVEIVLRPFIEVTPCDCQSCALEDEPVVPVIIPLEDVTDVMVNEYEDFGGDPNTPPNIVPVARWLRNRFGKLKRFLL